MWHEFFPALHEIIEQQEENAAALTKILQEDDSENLCHICFQALEKMNVTPSGELVKALAMAGILAELPNDLPYHGNAHYHKVVTQLVRIIARHQQEGGALSDDEIAVLLIAACIHDLGHDGKGNIVEGGFTPGRMERYSFNMAAPYLRVAGIPDKALADIGVMLLCTDVLPIGADDSPSNLVRRAYQYHFEEAELPTLPEHLVALGNDSGLALKALMLHEADIATSAGISYEVTVRETRCFRTEIMGRDDARPSHIVDFLTHVCGRKMILPASRALYQAQMDEIFDTAKAAVEEGDKAFHEG